jgi:DNA phosphorothioation-associated putative methyltransferase
MTRLARHRTAMRRTDLSRPIRLALQHQLLTTDRTLFDYGCGRGDDIKRLEHQGYSVAGWDPHHRPDTERLHADVVNLGYVVNVIEDLAERMDTLRAAWELTKRVLVVSARLEDERDLAHVAPLRDGWVTRRGTFQKFYEHEELGAWIDQGLGTQSVAAGLGSYYVFRDATERETYLASRFRRAVRLPSRRLSDRAFEENRDILQPLMTFVEQRGRIPDLTELPHATELLERFGSLRRAFRIVLLVTDDQGWEHVRRERSVDLLVHIALARFHGRPRWSELPDPLQRDVRAFFSNYKAACVQADRLLFATGNADAVQFAMRASSAGKRTGNGLYVHESALSEVPALLRVYEGCARALVGTVEGATLIKLHRGEPCVSYLSYPDFDTDPHPALSTSVVCELRDRRVRVLRYEGRANPPILHRKEEFVTNDYPQVGKFRRLTAAEERAGLFEQPEMIGTLGGWVGVCADAGVQIKGHRVIRGSAPTAGGPS